MENTRAYLFFVFIKKNIGAGVVVVVVAVVRGEGGGDRVM